MKYSSHWDNLTHYLLLSVQRSWHEGVAWCHYPGMRSPGVMTRPRSWPWGDQWPSSTRRDQQLNWIAGMTTAANIWLQWIWKSKSVTVSNTEENQINSRRRWWENSRHLADCRSGWNARTQSSDSLGPETAGEKERVTSWGKVNSRLWCVMSVGNRDRASKIRRTRHIWDVQAMWSGL